MAVSGYAFGVLLLVGVAVIWVSASHLIKSIFIEKGFDRPFFLTYFNTCGFALWLLGACCKREWRDKLPPQLQCTSAAPHDTDARSPASQQHDSPRSSPASQAWREYFTLAVCFAPLWMSANYAFNLSLREASVATNSILSNTSSLWTMLLSIIFFHERAQCSKVLAVFLTVGGAAIVALSTEGALATTAHTSPTPAAPADTTQGTLLSLISAVCYAVYTVFLRAHVSEGIIMPVFFGYVGVVVLVAGLPVLMVLHATSLETFRLPSREVLFYLAVNAVIGTNISDVLWARAVVLTSPVVATLALSLTIPFGMASDVIWYGASFNRSYVAGSVLVLLGFILINIQGVRGSGSGSDSPAPGSDDEAPLSASSPYGGVTPRNEGHPLRLSSTALNDLEAPPEESPAHSRSVSPSSAVQLASPQGTRHRV